MRGKKRNKYKNTNHLVNGLDNLEHLVVADLAVAVNVVQLEGPVQLVLHLAAARDAQRADELLEVDRARLVRVEHVEHVVGECRRVAKREELRVDLLELALGERSRRAVLEEAWWWSCAAGAGARVLACWFCFVLSFFFLLFFLSPSLPFAIATTPSHPPPSSSSSFSSSRYFFCMV